MSKEKAITSPNLDLLTGNRYLSQTKKIIECSSQPQRELLRQRYNELIRDINKEGNRPVVD